MGLTGAGGALVAIPLFRQFLGMDLKQASVYSLVAVVLAASTNFFQQRSSADYRLGLELAGAAVLGSLLSLPLKAILPESALGALLAAVSVFSVYSVWAPPAPRGLVPGQRRAWYATALIGLALGALTTLTGLGGGVLMLPVLLSFYGKASQQSVATGLLAVGLSSLVSFLLQLGGGAVVPMGRGVLELLAGMLVAAYALKFLLKRLPAAQADVIRKGVFTVVVGYALVQVF